jgi:hypothetical protein
MLYLVKIPKISHYLIIHKNEERHAGVQDEYGESKIEGI